MTVEVETVEQRYVLRAHHTLTFGMSFIFADDFDKRAGQSAGHAVVGCRDHQGLECPTQQFARPGGVRKFGGILSCLREGRVGLNARTGNTRFLPDEVSIPGFVEAEVSDCTRHLNDAILFCHNRVV